MTFYICSCSHMCFWMIDLQLHPKYFFIHLNQSGNSRAEKWSQCWSVRNCVPLTGGNPHMTTMLKCPVLQHYMFTASNTKTVLPFGTIVDWAKIYPISFTWIYLGSELRVAVVCSALSHYLVHYHSYFLSPIFISCLKVKISLIPGGQIFRAKSDFTWIFTHIPWTVITYPQFPVRGHPSSFCSSHCAIHHLDISSLPNLITNH